MSRRILYYHTVMNRNDDELTKKVLLVQKDSMNDGDIYQLIHQDMEQLELSDNDITSRSMENLKQLINKKILSVAYNYLHKLATSHSKVRHEMYKNLDGMSYLFDKRFTSEQSKLLFRFRTRMADVRNNFRNNYTCTKVYSKSIGTLCKIL